MFNNKTKIYINYLEDDREMQQSFWQNFDHFHQCGLTLTAI